jgi:hypothetical protein
MQAEEYDVGSHGGWPLGMKRLPRLRYLYLCIPRECTQREVDRMLDNVGSLTNLRKFDLVVGGDDDRRVKLNLTSAFKRSPLQVREHMHPKPISDITSGVNRACMPCE